MKNKILNPENIETINYYNTIAKGYDKLYKKEQIKKIKLLKPYFSEEGKILDLGAGTGILNSYLNKEIILYSLDISKEMLNLNSNEKSRKIVINEIEIPFPTNFFDEIISFTMLQDSLNPIWILKEIKRVLKKDKNLILSFLKINNKEDIINFIKKNFEIVYDTKEEKDYLYILKNI